MGSRYFGEYVTPWALEHADTRFDWYVIVIDYIPKEIETSLDWTIIETLDYAFSNNEWIFHEFVKFYQQFLDKIDWHMHTIKNCIYNELHNTELTKLPYALNGNRYIIRDEIPFIKFIVYTTDELMERLHEASMEYDPFEEEIIPYVMSGKKFFCNMDYFRQTPEMNIFKHLIFRLSLVYVLIYLQISYTDYDEDWVKLVPKSVVDKVTKIANFDKDMGELDYYDIYNEYYVFYIFLIRCCNYNGKIIEEYIEGEVVKKDEEILYNSNGK